MDSVKKKAITEQYKQELLRKVKNPSIRDVKDTKKHTDVNRSKYRDSKKDIEDLVDNEKDAYVTAAVKKLKEVDNMFTQEVKDEEELETPNIFQMDAQDYRNVDDIYRMTEDILNYHGEDLPSNLSIPELDAQIRKIDPQGQMTKAEQIRNAIYKITDLSTLREILNTLFKFVRGENVVQEPAWKAEPVQEFSFDDSDAVELTELASKTAKKTIVTVSKNSSKVVFENGHSFTVDLAETMQQKSAGLEPYEKLDKSHGLLFPFNPASDVTFHMGKVKFPIDIMFLMNDKNKMKIGKIIHNAQPGSLDIWTANDVCAVLEICGGLSKELKLEEGTTCSFELAK